MRTSPHSTVVRFLVAVTLVAADDDVAEAIHGAVRRTGAVESPRDRAAKDPRWQRTLHSRRAATSVW